MTKKRTSARLPHPFGSYKSPPTAFRTPNGDNFALLQFGDVGGSGDKPYLGHDTPPGICEAELLIAHSYIQYVCIHTYLHRLTRAHHDLTCSRRPEVAIKCRRWKYYWAAKFMTPHCLPHSDSQIHQLHALQF